VSFFSEERANELKELFFESAAELLQVLNDQGLELEKRPGDAETVRGVRRTVHTLKGDSAACGFQELSSLAHEFEDALTPELAKRAGGHLAEVVLAAADIFHEMLQAYKTGSAPPIGDELRKAIRGMASSQPAVAVEKAAPAKPANRGFEWSEYEQVIIADALKRGVKVWQVSLAIDTNCLVRGAALQLAKTAMQDLGTVLVQIPEDGAPMDAATHIQAVITSSYDAETIAKKLKIPAVIAEVLVEPASDRSDDGDLLEIFDERAAAVSQGQEAGSTQSTLAENILRVDAERIDSVLNLVGEMIIGKSMLTQTISEFDRRFHKDPLHAKFADALAFQARVLNDLQKSVMKIRMVPVEQLFRRFPRMVRDVAKTCSKDVRLVVTGQDTDLDKSILDALAEPMAHLVRNAIGHGIESPAARTGAGKSPQGTVRLDAYHQGNEIVIEIADDGAGIDRAKVVRKAVERGIISSEEAGRLSEQDALNLIFHPGFSTADEVTSVSGRGVGMDVVKTVLERLKGSVRIETNVGEGTRFYLKVPLTLAIIKALMFRVADKLYAIPLNSVMEITRSVEAEVHTVESREVIRLREEVLPLIRLNPLANVKVEKQKKLFVVVIRLSEKKYGLVVDKLVGEEELVIKALDDHLVATDLVSGASILGDGTVVLILNLHSVVNRLGRQRALEASA
jgi:two-component system, chemotaxis family, sensor kinase CheA